MKTLFILMIFAVAAFADGVSGICPPVMTPDSQTVADTCAGLGQYVYAYRGTTGQVWFNDNNNAPGTFDDRDYNDAVAGFAISNRGFVTFDWFGSDSAWVDTI